MVFEITQIAELFCLVSSKMSLILFQWPKTRDYEGKKRNNKEKNQKNHTHT